jgi:hypothetical protein
MITNPLPSGLRSCVTVRLLPDISRYRVVLICEGGNVNYLWIFGHSEDEATTLPESARHHPVTWHHIAEEGRHVITPFKTKQLSEY